MHFLPPQRSTTRDDNMLTCDSIRCCCAIVLRAYVRAGVSKFMRQKGPLFNQPKKTPHNFITRLFYTNTRSSQPRLLPGSEMRAIFKSNTQAAHCSRRAAVLSTAVTYWSWSADVDCMADADKAFFSSVLVLTTYFYDLQEMEALQEITIA